MCVHPAKLSQPMREPQHAPADDRVHQFSHQTLGRGQVGSLSKVWVAFHLSAYLALHGGLQRVGSECTDSQRQQRRLSIVHRCCSTGRSHRGVCEPGQAFS